MNVEAGKPLLLLVLVNHSCYMVSNYRLPFLDALVLNGYALCMSHKKGLSNYYIGPIGRQANGLFTHPRSNVIS